MTLAAYFSPGFPLVHKEKHRMDVTKIKKHFSPVLLWFVVTTQQESPGLDCQSGQGLLLWALSMFTLC